MTYTIAVCTVKNSCWWTGNCPKHVEIYSKNKFEKLVHLVCFIVRLIHSFSNVIRQIQRFLQSVFSTEDYLLSSLKSSSNFLLLPPCLPVISILPSIFASRTCLRRHSYTKCDKSSYPSSFLLFIGYPSSPPPSLFVILYFPHDLSNWSSPSFSSTTFQKFPVISYLLSEVSNNQQPSLI